MAERSYSELVRIPTMQERFEYLKLCGETFGITFGSDRYVNQQLYRSKEWKDVRRKVIIRDNGCDLAMEGYSAGWKPTVHHIKPITLEMLMDGDPLVFDLENLVLCSHSTHNALHYGSIDLIPKPLVERKPNDTIPWR